MLMVTLNPVERLECMYICMYLYFQMAFSNPSLFSLISLQTNEKRSQINCEPTTETVKSVGNSPGSPDSGIAEVHGPKKLVEGGSRVKAQRSKSTPSYSVSKSALERRPTVESIKSIKSALLETESNAQNATTTANLSQQNKHSNNDGLKDQRKHDPCLQRISKSKLPKRSTSGDDVVLTARDTVLTDERVACKAQKQSSTKESSKTEAKVRHPLSKDRAPIKIADKVDKKHLKEKKDDFISDISGAEKQPESSVKTAQPVDKYPPNKDNKVTEHGESKVSLSSNSPNISCRTGKNFNITAINKTDGTKATQSQDSEQESPKIKTTLPEVLKSPKTGKLMFALQWPLRLKMNEMSFFVGKNQLVV